MVTIKLIEPKSEDVIRKTMPISHTVWPEAAILAKGG